jgi:hypothetical protein
MRPIAAFIALLVAITASFAQQGYKAVDPKQEKVVLAKLEKEQSAAKVAFDKSPKNPSAKKRFVATTVKLGTTCMYAQTLDRKIKYRRALSYYRSALKVDPTNKEAKTNSDLIISIYKSMGLPIPKG